MDGLLTSWTKLAEVEEAILSEAEEPVLSAVEGINLGYLWFIRGDKALKTVLGLYDDHGRLCKVVDELLKAGVPNANISLVAPVHEEDQGDGDTSQRRATANVTSPHVIDSLDSALPHLDVCTLPGLGVVIAAGPILGWLAHDTTGDGLLAALADWGVGPEETEFYAEGVRQGGALIAVKAPDATVDGVVDVLDRHDPVDIDRWTQLWPEAGWGDYGMVLRS